MYSVSQTFKDKVNINSQEYRLTGTIGSLSFTEANVVEGSFSINNQSTDHSDVVLGSCYIGTLQAEFTNISIDWNAWVGKVITPYVGLKIGPGANDWEDVPLGVFKVSKATHTAFGVQVTAYDNMTKFDKKFKRNKYRYKGTLWTFISQMCTECGVTCANTQQQIAAMPNGSRNLEIYNATGRRADFANDIDTYRDFLYWIAQTMGCFATMNRAGQLEFRRYTQNVVDNISDTRRLEGAAFEDYITHYVGIYVENLNDNTEDYYGYDAAALQAELNETAAEISSDNERIDELVDDLADWDYKLEHGQCTQAEYDTAVAEITAELHPLEVEVKRLNKRLKWLEEALQHAGDDGADMVLGANPLVMMKNITTKDAARLDILGALDEISYTPFSASVVCGPHYDLGDVIQFSGGLYNSATDTFGCVMAWTYTHNGGTELQGFGVDPAIVMVRTKAEKQARAARETADNAINASDYTLDKQDDPTTPPPSDAMKNNPVALVDNKPTDSGKRTMHYWTYNANYADPYYETFKGVVLSTSMPFVVCQVPHITSGQWREVQVAGKMRKDMDVYLIGRIEGYAGSTLSQYPVGTQEYKHISGLNGGAQYAYGERYNNLYNVGCVSKEYWYVKCQNGTTCTGIIEEDTPADFTFDSFADLVAAINQGDIVIDFTTNTPSDYVTKLPTQRTTNKVNKNLDKLNTRLSTDSNTRGLRGAVQGVGEDVSEDDFIAGADIINDNNMNRIASTINSIYDGIAKNVKDVDIVSGVNSRQVTADLFDGSIKTVGDVPTFHPDVVEPSELTEDVDNNSMLFVLGDNSGVDVTEGNEHDWVFVKFGFSFDDLGWYANTAGVRDSATHAHQYLTFQIDGLVSGQTASFKLSEYVEPYRQKRSFIIWSYNHTGGGYEIHKVDISCSVPFVICAYKYSNDQYSFTYNDQNYTKYPYWLDIIVDAGASGTPTLTYTDTVIQEGAVPYNIAWNTTPTQPLQWEGTEYYRFGSMEGGNVVGMLDDADMDYVYTDETAMAEGIGSVVWDRNFVRGVPLGVLFSADDEVTDFSGLPTDRGTWNSAKKFHSFFADGNWHELTCNFTASADTMYAHVVLDGLADCADNTVYAKVFLKKFLEQSQEYGIKKIYGKWGDKWYRYLDEEAGTTDYTQLSNKPQINGVILSGNKTSSDLGIVITLTQAQYDALTTEQKNDPNKVYYISDASGGGGSSPLFIDSSGYISIDYDLVRRES